MLLKSLWLYIRLTATGVVLILYVHYFVKQSWGFYTTEARQPLYEIYKIDAGILDQKKLIKRNVNYVMGISLKGRMLYNELYDLVKNKNASWKCLNEDSVNLIIYQGNYIEMPGSRYNSFKGYFLITKTERPEYNIIQNGKSFHPQRQYMLIHIR